jgi:ADP-heptose:LPS heptosyltransferase
MKILVISLAGRGDTLLVTPLIHELRANFPDARIDALVLWTGSRDILEGNPYLNAVHQWDFIKEGKFASLRFLLQLRKEGYDVSINTHPQSRIYYRIIARILGAPVRISHDYECSGMLDRLLVNRTIPQDYQKHTAENNLALLSFLGVKPVMSSHELEIFLSPADLGWAETFLAERQLLQRQLLGVHTGSGDTKNLALKRWPVEHYIGLFKALKESRPGLTVLLFGRGLEEERDMQRIIEETDPSFAVRAETKNLRQAAALIRKCTAFLSVDTALMHLAATVKVKRQIVIEAPTFNCTNEPYGHAYVLVKNPVVAGRSLEYYRYDGGPIRKTDEEMRRCMASVTVDAVLKAVNEALAT